MSTKDEITYEVKEHIGVITPYSTGWCKELNIVKWNDADPKYDIRDWSEDHQKMTKGITLHEDEMQRICELLEGRFGRRGNALPKGSFSVASRDDKRNGGPWENRSGATNNHDSGATETQGGGAVSQSCADSIATSAAADSSAATATGAGFAADANGAAISAENSAAADMPSVNSAAADMPSVNYEGGENSDTESGDGCDSNGNCESGNNSDGCDDAENQGSESRDGGHLPF